MTVIEFQKVSKKYKLYSKGGLYLRDRVTHALKRLNPFNGKQHEGLDVRHSLERDFLALKDVSFSIKKGESVGFIGRNGAGKSTILKLLAGVTKASLGQVVVNGKVAALIEVGAGFHPELTGRENIYMNGSILGMKKADIDRSFDSIVGFAELEKFIDTPVKHYSSGMYVRLGFAVAAHTNPDIFLIDEVLAVGDEGFQRKCLNLLSAHKAAGKTMILVSHQLNRIEEVCDRCIYLRAGQVGYDGTTSKAISQYRSDLTSNLHTAQASFGGSADQAHILQVTFHDQIEGTVPTVRSGQDLIVEIRYFAPLAIQNPVFGIALYGPEGELITGFNTKMKSFSIDAIAGEGSIFCRLPNLPLIGGSYGLVAQIHNFSDTTTYDRQLYRFCIEEASESTRGLVDLKEGWSFDVEFDQAMCSARNTRMAWEQGQP